MNSAQQRPWCRESSAPVQSLTIPECRELVEETLKLNTASEILERCLQLADSRYGDLLG
jgi:hypothetical protein